LADRLLFVVGRDDDGHRRLDRGADSGARPGNLAQTLGRAAPDHIALSISRRIWPGRRPDFVKSIR
jgi:hypothetical protein